MSDQYWLSEAQLERIKPYFPLSQGRKPERLIAATVIFRP
jgi:hypothetical protein